MTRGDAMDLVARISAAWPTPPLPDDTGVLYAEALIPFPADAGARAVAEMVAVGGDFRPSVGDVRRTVIGHAYGYLPAPETAWIEAREQLREPMRPLRDGERQAPPQPVYSHDLIRHAVATYPDVVGLAEVAETGRDFAGHRQAFQEHYNRLRRQVALEGRLPESVTPGNVDVHAAIEAQHHAELAPGPAAPEPQGGRFLNCSAAKSGHTTECVTTGWTDPESGRRMPTGRCGTYLAVPMPAEARKALAKLAEAAETRADEIAPERVTFDETSPLAAVPPPAPDVPPEVGISETGQKRPQRRVPPPPELGGKHAARPTRRDGD